MNTLPDDPVHPLTFNDLPKAVSELLNRVMHIEELLSGQAAVPETDELMDVKATAKFLNLSVSTLYTKVCRGEIPALNWIYR